MFLHRPRSTKPALYELIEDSIRPGCRVTEPGRRAADPAIDPCARGQRDRVTRVCFGAYSGRTRKRLGWADVVEVLAGSGFRVAPGRMLCPQSRQSAPTRHVPVEGDFARTARVRSECLAEERLCRGLSARLRGRAKEGLSCRNSLRADAGNEHQARPFTA
jgi:hypothetical protein